jgi:hypothetical protein
LLPARSIRVHFLVVSGWKACPAHPSLSATAASVSPRFVSKGIAVTSLHQRVLPVLRSERHTISYPATEECQMKATLIVLFLCTLASGSFAQTTGASCKALATDKSLSGAALTSFMKKCETDAAAACDSAATDKKLAGAAKTSFAKKCVSDAVGN